MEIFRKQTANKLTICDAPPQGWIPILACGLSGAFFILFNSSITTLNCQRQLPERGSCEFRQSGLRGSEVRKIRLDFLQGAEVRASHSGRSKSYRLFLLTEAGDIPFYSTLIKGNKHLIVSQINTFIANPSAKSLQVSEDGRLYGLSGGLLFWLFGAGILLLSTECLTCSFDQKRSLMTLKQRNTIFRTGVIAQPIREIETVKIESTYHSTKNKWGKTINFQKHYIVLTLKSGEHWRLTPYDTVILKGKQKIAEYISKYLESFHKLDSNLPEIEKLPLPQGIEKEIATWEEFIRVNPGHAEAYYQLGMALYRGDRRKEAAANLQRARDTFQTQGNSQKADVIQDFLWQLGLE